jgi:hypothetical protein
MRERERERVGRLGGTGRRRKIQNDLKETRRYCILNGGTVLVDISVWKTRSGGG